jgi:tripartite-type tricarboxylate transporter receptor subunit TctC
MYKKLSYERDRDFVPITGLIFINHALITHPSVPVQSVRELIELARKQPGQLNYGTFGIGSIAHVNMELFQGMTGVKLTPVHYRGATPALTDVIAGHIQMMFLSVGSAFPPWKDGRVKMLAINSAKRLASLPEMPTVSESGVPGFEGRAWFGLFAPAGTPRQIVDKLNAEVVRMLTGPEFREKTLVPQFFEPITGTSEEFGRFIAGEEQKWGKVLRDANIKVE